MMSRRSHTIGVLLALSLPMAAHAAELKVVADLIDQFDDKLAKNGMEIKPRGKLSSGRSTHRALYQHPVNVNDATITYSIKLPEKPADAQLAFVAWTCVLDTVLEQDKDGRCNGTRFIVRVDGKQVFERKQMPGGWLPVVVPLDAYAGETVDLQLATNAIDGNTNCDWAYWGDPRVMIVPEGGVVGTEPVEGFAGLVIAPAESVGADGAKLKVQAVDAGGKPASQETYVWLPPASGSGLTVAEWNVSTGLKRDATGVRAMATVGALPPGLRMVIFGAALSFGEPSSGRAIVGAGDDFPVCYVLSNKGPAPWVPRGHKVFIRMKECGKDDKVGLSGADDYQVATLEIDRVILPDEKAVFVHRFKVKSPGRVMVGAGFGRTAEEARRLECGRSLGVYEAAPVLTGSVTKRTAVEVTDNQVILETPACRVAFLKRTTGYKGLPGVWTADLQLPVGGRWQTVAVCPDLIDVCVGQALRKNQDKVPSGWRVNDLASRQFPLPFRQTRCDIAGVTARRVDDKQQLAAVFDIRFRRQGEEAMAPFSATLTCALDRSKPIVDVTGELTTAQTIHLRRFCPVSLRVADGLPTKDRGMALFPGLEYLDHGEPSSSTRDAAPPINNRLMPDPLKVTVPMMMVSSQVGMVILMWDPNQKWNGIDYGPCAAFASPNLVHRQENHLMELFVPTFPDYMNENERLAGRSHEMKPGKPVTVSARIVLRPKGDAVDALKTYFALNPPPEPAPKQHDLQTLYDIGRHGFMKTCWYQDKQKSSHCVGWAPANAPQFGVLLWLDSILAQDEAARKASRARAELIWRNTIRDAGPSGLTSPACCHIMREDAPFYTGHIEAMLKPMLGSVVGTIRGANADGVWGFQPPDDAQHRALGPQGYASQGIVARGALELTRKARITGSTDALKAGLRALAYLDRFRVPHGAQGWECPIFEPDILGSAYAVGAFVDVYEMTGDKKYLDKAIYWAWTGMAFQYVWQAPDREQWMRYASIPVFGTTFFTHSWLGNPVQWCGLVYAYFLQRLAPHDTSFPWKRIAEGMTVSGEWLQFGDERPELKGSYPDGLYKRLTDRCPAMINPEDIILNRYAVEGHDPRVKTRYVHGVDGKRIHISSSAKVGEPRVDGKKLTATLTFFEGEYSGTLLANCPTPAEVRAAGQTLEQVESIPEAPQGWRYLPESRSLIIRFKHATKDPITLTVGFK
ncbi:MAG: hypothetical protein JXQ73_05595 [Phycisphaerae bacterium]|nr:hypothetical protein [Phycisphaerae bacterium]